MEQVIEILANIELCMRLIAIFILTIEIAVCVTAVNTFFNKR